MFFSTPKNRRAKSEIEIWIFFFIGVEGENPYLAPGGSPCPITAAPSRCQPHASRAIAFPRLQLEPSAMLSRDP